MRQIELNNRYSISFTLTKKNVLTGTMIVMIVALFCLLIKFVVKSEGFVILLEFFIIVLSWILIMMGSFVLRTLMDGYKLTEQDVQYRRFFKVISRAYENIPCIIISTAFYNRSYVGKRKGFFSILNYPCITLAEARPVYLEKNWSFELHSGMIDHQIKEHEQLIYSFVWNDKNPPISFLKNFNGTCYITYSFLVRYCEEIMEWIQNNHNEKRQIYILEDCSDYKWFQRKIDFEEAERLKAEILARRQDKEMSEEQEEIKGP